MFKSALVIFATIGVMNAHGQENILNLSGSLNTRDLGGLKTTSGKHIKYGVLYRSSQLSYLSDEDLAVLKKLSLSTVVDFRTLEEANELPDRLPQNVKVIHAPIIGNHLNKNKIAEYIKENGLPAAMQDAEITQKYGPFTRMLYLVNSYRDPQYIAVTKQYKPFFDQLVKQPANKALLYHCTGGRDRTGLGTAFLLDILGVPMETIKSNYLESNELLQPDRNNPKSQEYKRFVFSNVFIQPVNNADYIEVANKWWSAACNNIQCP